MKPILTIDRPMQVWLYSASHGLLLLRGQKVNDVDKRIDVLFRGVQAIETRMQNLECLSIVEVSISDLEMSQSKPQDLPESDLKAFLLNCEGWTGYVVAGSVEWIEDELAYWEPSSLNMSLDKSVARHLFIRD